MNAGHPLNRFERLMSLFTRVQPGEGRCIAILSLQACALMMAWYLIRRKRPAPPAAAANRDVNLDIGEQVLIEAWNADGTASVRFRGAQWTAVARPGNPPSAGMHRVAEVVGNRLVVEKS